MTLFNDKLFDEGEGLFELNPSKLQCYLDCPRQYRFRYVDRRPERRQFGPTALGRTVHKALRDFYALDPKDRTEEELVRLLRRSWDRAGYRSAKEAEEAYDRAEDMLRRYYAGNDPRRHRVVALESKFSHARSSEGLLITGRVDRIDLDEGQYVIVDYKTGRFGEDQYKLDESLPLTLYAIAVSWVMGRPVSRIAVEHLTSGRRAETWRDRDRQTSDWRKLNVVAKQMRTSTTFPPTPSALCRWCDYLVACPEGRASLREAPQRTSAQVPNEAPIDVPLPIEEPM